MWLNAVRFINVCAKIAIKSTARDRGLIHPLCAYTIIRGACMSSADQMSLIQRDLNFLPTFIAIRPTKYTIRLPLRKAEFTL